MDRIVLATRNPGKVAEMRPLFAGLGLETFSLSDFPGLPEVEETGLTFEENALLKARAVSAATGLVALADDSGLEVDALGGAPGVHSARYSAEPGRPATPERNNAKLLEAMRDVPDAKRSIRFICVMAVCAPHNAECLVTRGAWEGRLNRELVGAGGFGYDPLFFDPELNLSAAQLTREQKNQRSHRGKAACALRQAWPDFLEKLNKL